MLKAAIFSDLDILVGVKEKCQLKYGLFRVGQAKS